MTPDNTYLHAASDTQGHPVKAVLLPPEPSIRPAPEANHTPLVTVLVPPNYSVHQTAWPPPPSLDQQREERERRERRICAALDIADGVLGWIPGVGQMVDVVSTCVCVTLFGPKAFLILLEMVDITGVVGAFVPTCSLVAMSCHKKNHA